MKQERRQNGRCNRVARPEKPDRLSEARDFSHGFFTKTADDNTADSLLDKYKNGGSADVDDELEKMKKELGL
ncbi:hypothetical protein LI294_06295 [bacterium 210702-DFI.5.13]|nr:hypothetical protein [bacterium 210702-DFI.5.13]